MPNFRNPYQEGLHYKPKNVKMCQLGSGASWKAGMVLVKTTETADNSTQWYGSKSGKTEQIIPRANKILASAVASGGIIASGTSQTYDILGISTTDAPLTFLQTGTPTDMSNWFQNSSVFENMYIFGYVTDEPIWMPYSGTAPSAGDYVTLSSGSDGYVDAVTDPYRKIIIGKVIRVSSGSEGPQVWTDEGVVPKCLVDPTYKRGW